MIAERSEIPDKDRDRRRFRRIGYSARATIIDKQGNLARGEIGNLSLKGAYVRADNVIVVGENVDIEIEASSLSSELKFKLKGRLVRSDKEGLGVEFEEMDLDSFMHLKTIVALNYGDSDKIEEEFHEFLKQKMLREGDK